jgi:hypothetical protein
MPQKRRVVEEAQSRIVARVRALEEADQIVISRGDGDDELVARAPRASPPACDRACA